jgi:uncharacterized membrane protein
VNARYGTLINGVLIGIGALLVFDNVVFHWLLAFHRAIPGPYALHAEIVLVAAGAVMIIVGLRREARARKTRKTQ